MTGVQTCALPICRAAGTENVFGTSPRYEDLDWNGMDFSRAQYDSVIGVDRAAWRQELSMHDELFQRLAWHLPTALTDVRARIASQLG